jgi:hypothetical protein
VQGETVARETRIRPGIKPSPIEWFTDFTVMRLSGCLCGAATEAFICDLVASPQFDDLRFLIIDLSDVESVDFSERDFLVFGAMFKAVSKWRCFQRPMKLGYVVESEEFGDFVQSLMTQVSRFSNDRWVQEVHREFDGAYAWALEPRLDPVR